MYATKSILNIFKTNLITMNTNHLRWIKRTALAGMLVLAVTAFFAFQAGNTNTHTDESGNVYTELSVLADAGVAVPDKCGEGKCGEGKCGSGESKAESKTASAEKESKSSESKEGKKSSAKKEGKECSSKCKSKSSCGKSE